MCGIKIDLEDKRAKPLFANVKKSNLQTIFLLRFLKPFPKDSFKNKILY